jgi:UDP-4-amino-4,6-dideoxy-N-acetyl-beta-L-altrosamine N-acetyltransferase
VNILKKNRVQLVGFRELKSHEKLEVLKWRNLYSIRKWMFTQDKISFNSHLKFIRSLAVRSDKQYFALKKGLACIGVVSLVDIDSEKANIGLYANPNRKRQGRVLTTEVVKFAFEELLISKVIAEVFHENKKAYKLYKSCGFVDKETSHADGKKVIVMEKYNENRYF